MYKFQRDAKSITYFPWHQQRVGTAKKMMQFYSKLCNAVKTPEASRNHCYIFHVLFHGKYVGDMLLDPRGVCRLWHPMIHYLNVVTE